MPMPMPAPTAPPVPAICEGHLYAREGREVTSLDCESCRRLRAALHLLRTEVLLPARRAVDVSWTDDRVSRRIIAVARLRSAYPAIERIRDLSLPYLRMGDPLRRAARRVLAQFAILCHLHGIPAVPDCIDEDGHGPYVTVCVATYGDYCLHEWACSACGREWLQVDP